MNKLDTKYLESRIKHEEYTSFTTKSGQILRWCILTTLNGFAVVGDPSVCVDPVNDDEGIGKAVAKENSFNMLWALEGYLLKEELYTKNVKS